MDLLSSLGLGDALPEQSTRLSSHPGIIKALDTLLNGGKGDVRLGFNACLNCGADLSKSKTTVKCKACKRVQYCSKACRKADTLQHNDGDDDACGHSPVICALLNLCNEDDDAEEELENENNNSNGKKHKNKSQEAARYRVQTELESYPATLFNVLAEGPPWFVDAIAHRIRSMEDPQPIKRRGKRDRTSPGKPTQKKREVVLHIVGAQVDSELWGWNGTTTYGAEKNDKNANAPVLNAYAEASTNLASHLQTLIGTPSSVSIRCVFVGPDCPKSSPIIAEVPLPDSKNSSSSSTLTFETHCCNYGEKSNKSKSKQQLKQRLPAPDAIVFFNPGFSCPDYDWSTALSAAAAHGKPFLITTNTEMEGFADIKCLLDGGYIDPRTLPRDILEAVDHHDPTASLDEEEDGEGMTFFFGENPYAGLRVRQSGTMGNDLYGKSRWILGGLFQSGGGNAIGSKKNQKHVVEKEHSDSGDDRKSGEDIQARKKHRGGDGHGVVGRGGGKNTKKKNPALI